MSLQHAVLANVVDAARAPAAAVHVGAACCPPGHRGTGAGAFTVPHPGGEGGAWAAVAGLRGGESRRAARDALLESRLHLHALAARTAVGGAPALLFRLGE